MPFAPTLNAAACSTKGTTTSPVFGQKRNAWWSDSASDQPGPSGARDSSFGLRRSDTSKIEICVPSGWPASSASWPMPSSRLSPIGCR